MAKLTSQCQPHAKHWRLLKSRHSAKAEQILPKVLHRLVVECSHRIKTWTLAHADVLTYKCLVTKAFATVIAHRLIGDQVPGGIPVLHLQVVDAGDMPMQINQRRKRLPTNFTV